MEDDHITVPVEVTDPFGLPEIEQLEQLEQPLLQQGFCLMRRVGCTAWDGECKAPDGRCLYD